MLKIILGYQTWVKTIKIEAIFFITVYFRVKNHNHLLKTDDIHPPKTGNPFTFHALYPNGDAKLVIFL